MRHPLKRADLQVAAVYEDRNNAIQYFSTQQWNKNAAKALSVAAGIGQPTGSAIS